MAMVNRSPNVDESKIIRVLVNSEKMTKDEAFDEVLTLHKHNMIVNIYYYYYNNIYIYIYIYIYI